MIGKTSKEKEEGTRILNNYKKQLAEKMAREKAERGEALSTNTQSFKKSLGGGSVKSRKSGGKSTKSGRSSKRHAGGDLSVEAMEPEILLRILYGKGGAAGASVAASTIGSKK